MSLPEKFLVAVVALLLLTIVVEFILWNIDRAREQAKRDREEGGDDEN